MERQLVVGAEASAGKAAPFQGVTNKVPGESDQQIMQVSSSQTGMVLPGLLGATEKEAGGGRGWARDTELISPPCVGSGAHTASAGAHSASLIQPSVESQVTPL